MDLALLPRQQLTLTALSSGGGSPSSRPLLSPPLGPAHQGYWPSSSISHPLLPGPYADGGDATTTVVICMLPPPPVPEPAGKRGFGRSVLDFLGRVIGGLACALIVSCASGGH